MSERNIGIRFDVNAKELQVLQKAIDTLNKFNTQASKLVTASEKVNKAFDNQSKSANKSEQSMVNFGNAMSKFEQKMSSSMSTINKYERAQHELNEKLTKYGRNVKVTVDQNGKINGSFTDVNGNVIKVSGSYDALENKINNFKTSLTATNNVINKHNQQLAQTKKKIEDAHAEAIRMNRAFNDQKDKIDQLAAKYTRLHRGLDITNVLRNNGNKFDVYTNAIEKNTRILRGGIDQNGKFTQKIVNQKGELVTITGYYDKLNQRLIQYSRNVQQATQAQIRQAGAMSLVSQRTGLLAESQKGLNKQTLSWNEAMAISAIRMLQWSAAATAIYGTTRGFRDMLNVIIEVDTQMTELKKVMSDDTNFDNMLKTSIDLATELGRTVTDINEAMIEFGRQGLNEEQVELMARATTLMANVGDIDAGEAASKLTGIVTVFKREFSDATSIVDRFNEVQNNYATTVEILTNSVSKAGGTAASFGKYYMPSSIAI